jgi:hypothetical protein
MCVLDKQDLDRYDLCQGSVKMIFVTNYDHIIYYGERKQCYKEIEIYT